MWSRSRTLAPNGGAWAATRTKQVKMVCSKPGHPEWFTDWPSWLGHPWVLADEGQAQYHPDLLIWTCTSARPPGSCVHRGVPKCSPDTCGLAQPTSFYHSQVWVWEYASRIVLYWCGNLCFFFFLPLSLSFFLHMFLINRNVLPIVSVNKSLNMKANVLWRTHDN